MREVDFAKMKDERLCPIIFYVPFGCLIVMLRCKPITDEQFQRVIDSDFREKPFLIPVESKIDSFGIFKEKIVAIDYGS